MASTALRIREGITAWLPLLLMGLLALFTWWLVKHTPQAGSQRDAAPERHEPDYTMSGFALERFDAAGKLKVRIEGEQMRHYPDTDRIEVDTVRIRSVAPDGRITLASAKRALANGDASEVQLLGAATVDSSDAGGGGALTLRGEFLHAWLVAERVKSHLPVDVTANGATVHAAGIDYDHGRRLLDLQGPTRAVFPPAARRR